MHLTLRRMGWLAAMCLFGAGLMSAQGWRTTDKLPGVDLTGLSSGQKTTALKVMREHGCTCGCNMKVAECRIADTSCGFSRGLAEVIVSSVKQGKNEADTIAAVDNSRLAHRAEPKLLDDPVQIPTAGSPEIGRDNAPVTIVEFSDFQCPYCAQAAPQIEAALHEYPLQVRLIFKQFPLDNHPRAGFAAAAALAAQKQGKFWQMHDALFANRTNLSRENVFALAQKNGLDLKRFEADMNSTGVRDTIAKDVADGDHAGVEGTPTIFINGRRYNGSIELAALKPVLDDALKPVTAKTQTAKR